MHENPHAGQGSVLLDIGDDVGALVVTTPLGMVGLEVEMRPAGAGYHPEPDQTGAHAHWPHVAVVVRPTPAGPLPSLVFGAVPAGRYELYRRPHGPVELTVDVVGATVTEAVWPS
jgi:hypothetical protein